ncbi:MAG: hypothetical protein E5Y00_11660 [Mesorhizobium sp.]|nr:MAG: hypothetical protein E5Y00_11660 [Mesorhizobium sp.]
MPEGAQSGEGDRGDQEDDGGAARLEFSGSSSYAAILRATLWPAGHLPHGWGDWLSSRLSPIANVEG